MNLQLPPELEAKLTGLVTETPESHPRMRIAFDAVTVTFNGRRSG
jgi:hypothetical protein